MIYVDASALGKLVVSEAESQALKDWLASRLDRVSSALAKVELLRLARRAAQLGSGSEEVGERESSLVAKAVRVLESISLLQIDDGILERAAKLDPPKLRALDALHLASALSLSTLDGIVTYDARMSEAARSIGLAVYAPGTVASA